MLNPPTLLQAFARSFHREHYGHPGCCLNAYHDQRSAQFSIILLTLMIRSQVEFLLVKANDPIQPSIEQHQACNNVAHTNVSPIQFEWTSISLWNFDHPSFIQQKYTTFQKLSLSIASTSSRDGRAKTSWKLPKASISWQKFHEISLTFWIPPWINLKVCPSVRSPRKSITCTFTKMVPKVKMESTRRKGLDPLTATPRSCRKKSRQSPRVVCWKGKWTIPGMSWGS